MSPTHAKRPRARNPGFIAQGYNNPEIARALALRPKTVRKYVSNIRARLQAAGRAQATPLRCAAGAMVIRAPEAGLGRPLAAAAAFLVVNLPLELAGELAVGRRVTIVGSSSGTGDDPVAIRIVAHPLSDDDDD